MMIFLFRVNRIAINRNLFLLYLRTASTKIFHEFENEYAHSVMEKSPSYRGYLFTKQKSTEIKSIDIKLWTRFVDFLTTEKDSEKTDILQISREMCKYLPKINDEEIETVFQVLYLNPDPLSRDLRRIYGGLDSECVTRLKNWNTRQKLLIADYYFLLKLSRVYTYNSAMINDLINLVPKLTCHEIVQLMFYINLQRDCSSKIMSTLENKILKCLSSLSTEEIAIIAMAYFKTQNSIRSNILLQSIAQRFLNDAEILPDLAISAFSKLLRHSRRANLTSTYVNILDNCVNMIEKWHPSASLNMALITTTSLIDHPTFVEVLTKKMLDNLPEIRLKELCNLLTCVAVFGYQFKTIPNFYSVVVDELRSDKRQEELKLYPGHLISSLLCLAYHEVFPVDLLKQVFKPEFYHLVKEKTKYAKQREYYVMDSTVRLELSNYEGDLLPSVERQNIWKKDGARIPQSSHLNLSFYENLLLKIRSDIARILGGYQFVSIIQILPHFHLPDIFVHFDDDGKPIPINLKPSFNSQHAPPIGKSLCFIVGGRSCYTQNTRQPLPMTNMKRRQLKILGYEVTEIPWFEYRSLPKTRIEDYVKEKLNRGR